ncbi:ATP-binding protein [Tumidithrix elongata RA019]|uniref:ATP-binding protein n=1 Tax=Tumidithrix elongata BACA0141 TaxID=2716417 RepID=A0AAW9PSX4_9CYAN|nr:ATP-binding protein [Tumidithrix elongata RA019]
MKKELFRTIYQVQSYIASLLLYQDTLAQPAGQTYRHLLQTLIESAEGIRSELSCLKAYGEWFKAIAQTGQSWRDYILQQILTADNPFSQQAQKRDFASLPNDLVAAAKHDLRILQKISNLGGETLTQWIEELASDDFKLEDWVEWSGTNSAFARGRSELLSSLIRNFQSSNDWTELVESLAEAYRQNGTGLFAEYVAFRWQAGKLLGLAYPDYVNALDLVGYETQRNALLKNTEFLLAGYAALNVLLYGSRGSGKSSLVKSLLHQYGDRGLRLIEVARSDLKDLLAIMEVLRNAPQKFILFVDDLSFEKEEDDYKALKVLLEGNLNAKPANIVVYATSNRRHLLREYFGDRPRPSATEEVHPWDTVQEKMSLSDRFGLVLTFEPSDQDTYLKIVHHLAHKAGIDLTAEDLEFRALQWATRHNGRSGRTAQQFIDFLHGELQIGLTPFNSPL